MEISVHFDLPKDEFEYNCFIRSEELYELVRDFRDVLHFHDKSGTEMTEIDQDNFYQRASEVLCAIDDA